MGDHAMALMQQQMQQTMNAREQAAQAAAELAAQRQQQQGDSLLQQSVKDTALDTDKPAEDQQDTILTGHKTRDIRSPTLRNSQDEHSYLANQRQNFKPQNNPQTAPIVAAAPQDELKSLDMMMQQLLQDAPAADNDTEQSVEVDPSETEQPAEVVQPRTEPVPVCKYTPKVPYPVPAKATRKDREEMKCKKMLLMKGLISGKISEDSNFMIISKECSAVLQNKTIRKLGDPGKFVLSLQVGRTVFSCSLVDLGSSVNLIPYSVARRYVPISYHTL
ncbi:hypothetical protein F2Q68_00030984 [Brassica cretica]|uniref:Aspartic peptidase DDI1-type domain-containing protein n=1 Tax=Brassica cretica TaxID=69181 RepID=A0A8S9G9V7_BRACR|nr:hypothetical protein F2Q68_00030984 [Brassica cretica]